MPRNTELNKQVNILLSEAEKLGYKIEVDRTLDSDSYILSNKDASRAVIIGRVDINGTSVISTFIINIYKWRWAEAEGFTKEEMMGKLGKEIFSSIDLEYVSRYLGGEDII